MCKTAGMGSFIANSWSQHSNRTATKASKSHLLEGLWKHVFIFSHEVLGLYLLQLTLFFTVALQGWLGCRVNIGWSRTYFINMDGNKQISRSSCFLALSSCSEWKIIVCTRQLNQSTAENQAELRGYVIKRETFAATTSRSPKDWRCVQGRVAGILSSKPAGVIRTIQ